MLAPVQVILRRLVEAAIKAVPLGDSQEGRWRPVLLLLLLHEPAPDGCPLRRRCRRRPPGYGPSASRWRIPPLGRRRSHPAARRPRGFGATALPQHKACQSAQQLVRRGGYGAAGRALDPALRIRGSRMRGPDARPGSGAEEASELGGQRGRRHRLVGARMAGRGALSVVDIGLLCRDRPAAGKYLKVREGICEQ